MTDFTDETDPITKGDTIFLGIIGSRIDTTQENLIETLLNPILQELGRTPDRMILPSEGISSIYISDWADTLRIPTQIYEADWRKHSRRAKIFRDARIQQESTHFLVFLNKRSEYNEKLALRLAKQGYPVFTVTYSDWSLELLTCEREKEVEEPSVKKAVRGKKNKNKLQQTTTLFNGLWGALLEK